MLELFLPKSMHSHTVVGVLCSSGIVHTRALPNQCSSQWIASFVLSFYIPFVDIGSIVYTLGAINVLHSKIYNYIPLDQKYHKRFKAEQTLRNIKKVDTGDPALNNVHTFWPKQMADIFQTIYSDAYFCIKMYESRFRYYWNLFPRVQ